MKSTPVDQFIEKLPAERKQAMSALRKIILKNLPSGFS